MENNNVKQSLGTDDVIAMIAERRGFTKGDVKEILDELKNIFEECVQDETDINIRGFIHMRVVPMTYKKPTGIVKHRGLNDFVRKTKRINYQVPLNFKNLIRKNVLEQR